jgi:hypothetical protein
MTRVRGRRGGKSFAEQTSPPSDTTSWITFLCGFWVMLREVNLAALFQGWKFLPDFLSLPTHSNLHWSVKHKSGIDWWDFVIIFSFFLRESFDVEDLYGILKNVEGIFSREIVFNKRWRMLKMLGGNFEARVRFDEISAQNRRCSSRTL